MTPLYMRTSLWKGSQSRRRHFMTRGSVFLPEGSTQDSHTKISYNYAYHGRKMKNATIKQHLHRLGVIAGTQPNRAWSGDGEVYYIPAAEEASTKNAAIPDKAVDDAIQRVSIFVCTSINPITCHHRCVQGSPFGYIS
eukprot:GHVU01203233.1.p1 GENE.GHVU01203233.1~~GHVU01203233.1.p1  ORF type:complete len:138 (+),score=1.45 GHVU01203233.1:147-560(+)